MPKITFELVALDDGISFEKPLKLESREVGIEFNYPDPTDRPSLRIGLQDVRAADSIIIEYDFEKDGYEIYMSRTIDMGLWSKTTKEKELVAFIPSWNDPDHDDVVIDRRPKRKKVSREYDEGMRAYKILFTDDGEGS